MKALKSNVLVNNRIQVSCEYRGIMFSIILLSSISVGNVCDLMCAGDALPMGLRSMFCVQGQRSGES